VKGKNAGPLHHRGVKFSDLADVPGESSGPGLGYTRSAGHCSTCGRSRAFGYPGSGARCARSIPYPQAEGCSRVWRCVWPAEANGHFDDGARHVDWIWAFDRNLARFHLSAIIAVKGGLDCDLEERLHRRSSCAGADRSQAKVEPATGLEPVTSSLPRTCSTN
jgi:hypothetical protein